MKTRSSKLMKVLLWTAQLLLCSGFIWAGITKLFTPADQLAVMWPWTAGHPFLVKLTGILDILAGLGLVLPTLLRIQPRLTVYTAYAAISLMIAASLFHIARGEAAQIGVNLVFMGLAGLVAWGRSN